MNYKAEREELINVCKEVKKTKLNEGTAGNISIRAGDGFLITPSGIDYSRLESEDLVFIKDGKYYGEHFPSSEWQFHSAILEARKDIESIVHTHSKFATIISCSRKVIPAIHYMIGFSGEKEIRCCDYGTFGTKELSENMIATLGKSNGLLMSNHGAITVGKSPKQALHFTIELEELAEIYYRSLLLDERFILSDKEMERVLQRFQSYGKQKDELSSDKSIEKIEYPDFGGKSL